MSVLKNRVHSPAKPEHVEAKVARYNKYTLLMLFELSVSVLILGYGFYNDNTLMIVLGGISMALSFLQPAKHAEKALLKKMARR